MRASLRVTETPRRNESKTYGGIPVSAGRTIDRPALLLDRFE